MASCSDKDRSLHLQQIEGGELICSGIMSTSGCPLDLFAPPCKIEEKNNFSFYVNKQNLSTYPPLSPCVKTEVF